MRIAHISDLHFSNFSFRLDQFFSKRWLGNLNCIINRSDVLSTKRIYSLIDIFKKQKITDVIVSGDLTTTSSKAEFQQASNFIEKLKAEGLLTYLIPGNHDHYIPHAYKKKIFYRYFPSKQSHVLTYNLKDEGVTAIRWKNRWWLVLMDTTLSTSFFSSNGYFSPLVEKHFLNLLKEVPPNEKILLVNHFPFFQHDQPKRRLKRGHILEKIIQNHPKIQIYLHGHTHRRCIADLRQNRFPLILDSGSTAYRFGSWNLLDLNENSCFLSCFNWEKDTWIEKETKLFQWNN